jgi:recombination protein RecA
MAKGKKPEVAKVSADETTPRGKSSGASASSGADDFAAELIKTLNRERGQRVAYNLSVDESPTHVKRWISTGSRLLDYIVSNRRNGGIPEGRIIEIAGPPSIGKSHIAIQLCRSVQRMGGLIVYIDTENATSVDNLAALGVDVARRFVFVETACTEEVFAIAESTIIKAKAAVKDVPILIVWDSVAASSPKAELLGDYDKDTIGLQARTISKGMRKITEVIGVNNVTFLALNQLRTKIGVLYGDPEVTPGGNAIPFHASVRVRLSSGMQLKDEKTDEVYGIKVIATTKKNKVAPPFRKIDFEIHFGKGIEEYEQMFDLMREKGNVVANGKSIDVEGEGAWKTFRVSDPETGEVLIEKKFTKSKFSELWANSEYLPYLEDHLEGTMVRVMTGSAQATFVPADEVEALALEDAIISQAVAPGQVEEVMP